MLFLQEFLSKAPPKKLYKKLQKGKKSFQKANEITSAAIFKFAATDKELFLTSAILSTAACSGSTLFKGIKGLHSFQTKLQCALKFQQIRTEKIKRC